MSIPFMKLSKRVSGFINRKRLLSKLNSGDKKLIECIHSEKLTYLSESKLASIVTTCQQIESSKINGAFIEAGCALGGSSILIASTKNHDRPLFIYDVFGMIPAPTTEDTQDVHDRYKVISEGESKGISGDKYYGYENNLLKIVKNNLQKFGIDYKAQAVSLIKGLLQDTMQVNQTIAFAHIDVDWYDPVKTSLERIFPKLASGGSIILDDYHDWGGCRKATDEYLDTVAGQFSLNDSAGSLKITKY